MLRGHYRKSLLTFLIFASLPGLIVGGVLYIVSKNQIETELQQVHDEQFVQTVETMDEQFSYLEQSMAHWAFDPQFTENLKNLDFANNYQEIHEIYRTLLVMEGSNPLIGRVELYLREPASVVFTPDRYDRLTPERSEPYQALLSAEKSLYWSGGNGTVMLVHKIHSLGGADPFGALVLYLEKEKVLQLVQTLTPYNQGTSFLYDASKGQWLYTISEGNAPSKLDAVIMEEILRTEKSAETFLLDWESNRYSVTHGSFARMGVEWHYASAAPLTSITAPVIFLSKMILYTSGGLLLLAAVGSWFVSRRLYSPIDRLMKLAGVVKPEAGAERAARNEFELIETHWNHLSRESQILQRRLDEQLPQLREGFLMQLLHGYMYAYTDDELINRIESFGGEARDRRFCIVLIQLLGFSKLEGRFSDGDEGLVTFAAANMVEEIVATFPIRADVVNFQDLSLGLLVAIPSRMSREQFEEAVYRASEELLASIERYLKLQAVICIGRTTASIKSVPVLFEEAKLAAGFRHAGEGNLIIDIEKMDDAGRDHAPDYPFDLERQTLRAVRVGNADEAVAGVRAFVQAFAEAGVKEGALKQGMLHLLGSLLRVVLQSGLNAQQVYEGANLYEQLLHVRESDALPDWFDRKVIRPFIRELSQKQNAQMRQTIEKAAELLRESYRSDISLDSCADRLKISPFILSKMFKEIVGVNFIDYLTDIRLEKARELLRDTDLKISEVAESVGYQHSYFNRLFKKKEGVTPTHYREISRTGG
ncbi:helix-turn-helix domain-containing protein [Cohnella massiliensis]|uniref:helix-turn-helix domain-containing protein n=1 Tax=Cohnella massiliensis TaxID=1816691 RepID=UPI0009BB038D|nr:AraC family transcriptional regulator [Cohnella massiliensis]